MGRAPCASQSPARLYVLQGGSTAGPSHYRTRHCSRRSDDQHAAPNRTRAWKRLLIDETDVVTKARSICLNTEAKDTTRRSDLARLWEAVWRIGVDAPRIDVK